MDSTFRPHPRAAAACPHFFISHTVLHNPSSYAVGLPCDSSDPNQVSWRYISGTKAIMHGDLCLDFANADTVAVTTCHPGSATQQFSPGSNGEVLTANGQCLDVWDFAGPRVDIYPCNGGPNQLFHFTSEGQLVTAATPAYPARCLSISPSPPGGASSPAFQVWAKPLSATDWALFVLNALPSNATNVTLDLQGLIGVQGALRLRDVWQRRDLGTVQGTWTVTVPALDSLLVRLSPAA